MGVEYDGTYIELWSTGVIGNGDCEHGVNGVRECILIVEYASCVFACVLQYIYCEVDQLGNAVLVV